MLHYVNFAAVLFCILL